MRKVVFIILWITLYVPTLGADGNHRDYSPKSPEANPREKGVPEYTEGYMIMTTKEQDKKAKAAVKTELDKDYNVLTSNCAQAVQQGLKSAGLNPGNGILPKKEVYPSIYKNNKGKFILYYNTYKNQYYKVKK